MKTSTTASRQPFRTASFPSHRSPRLAPSLVAPSPPPEPPQRTRQSSRTHLRDKRRIPHLRQDRPSAPEISSPRRSTERVYRDAFSSSGTAHDCDKSSPRFRSLCARFFAFSVRTELSFTLRAIWESGTSESGAFWSGQAGGSSSSLAIWAVGRQVKYSLEKTARSATKTPHQQTRPFSSC